MPLHEPGEGSSSEEEFRYGTAGLSFPFTKTDPIFGLWQR